MGPSRCFAILDRLVAARRRHGSPEALLNSRFFRNGVVMLALVVVALAVVVTVLNQTTPTTDLAHPRSLNNVAAGSFATVEQEGSTLTVTPKGDATKYTVV